MNTLHKTLCTQQIVPHAADRCAVILVPAFWGNSPRNKEEGRLLFILYRHIFFGTHPLYVKQIFRTKLWEKSLRNFMKMLWFIKTYFCQSISVLPASYNFCQPRNFLFTCQQVARREARAHSLPKKRRPCAFNAHKFYQYFFTIIFYDLQCTLGGHSGHLCICRAQVSPLFLWLSSFNICTQRGS